MQHVTDAVSALAQLHSGIAYYAAAATMNNVVSQVKSPNVAMALLSSKLLKNICCSTLLVESNQHPTRAPLYHFQQ